jgi:hypothetical protein
MTAVARRDIFTMETYSGKFIDFLNPTPEQVCLADIATGLANTCRFGGQVNRWYSVAEHSVRCAERLAVYGDPEFVQLAALLHDAHEAYTGDITAPLKVVLGQALRDTQDRLDVVIAEKFGLLPGDFKLTSVKAVDDEMLFAEAAGLKYSHGIGEHWGNDEYHEPLVAYGWSPAEAERRFIECYERLR